MAQSNFQWTRKTFDKKILNDRQGFPQDAAAKRRRVLVTIDRVSAPIDVTNKAGEPVVSVDGTGQQLQKCIINVQANSGIAMRNPENLATLKAAYAAEKAGEAGKAHELFQTLANKLQVSFNVLSNQSVLAQLAKNVEIGCNLELITTDKGSLISIDPKTITVMEPEVFGSMTMSVEDEDDDVDSEFGAGEGDEFDGMDKKALIAAYTAAKLKGLTKNSTEEEFRTALRTASALAV